MLVTAHMAGPPREEEALLPLYCLQAWKHLFQLPPLFSVNVQFLLGHLPTALMRRTHRLWVTVRMAPPGKRKVEKNLVGDALGTWGTTDGVTEKLHQLLTCQNYTFT